MTVTLPRTHELGESIARYSADDDPIEALSAMLGAFGLIARATAARIRQREPYPAREADATRWESAASRAVRFSVDLILEQRKP